MKLTTEVICGKGSAPVGLDGPVCLLGSCFADEIGRKMSAAGFRTLANPFGTLYNPASIANAVARLDNPVPFREEDCVPLGAGDGRTGSFSHHTSFARSTATEFLETANAALAEAAATWRECGTVILSLGTAFVWRALERPGQPVVANCLKRPTREFAHELLSTETCAELLHGTVEAHPEKRFILTVSPIRHFGEGAHANTVSKATLHLVVQNLLSIVDYFPAYEILMDELRDYRFYAEDLVHPSPTAVEIIWERFLDAYALPTDLPRIRDNEKAARAALHRSLR
jgi:hypothetical protein